MPDSAIEGFTLTNPVRERVAAGGVAYGLNVRLVRSGEIARIARATGHDFLYLDAQHALFDVETLGHLVHASLGCGVAPFVRVRSVDDPDISVLLDAGATGIVAPDVTSAAEARRLVDATKYLPLGRRSLAGLTIHHDYRPVPSDVQMRVENEGVLVFCMIESIEGLEALEAIAAVPGVDGIYLGMNDMLASMGRAGAYEDPLITDALDQVVRVARSHGQIVGAGGIPRPPDQARAVRAGVQFLTTKSDIGMLRAGAAHAIDEIAGAVAVGSDGAAPTRTAVQAVRS